MSDVEKGEPMRGMQTKWLLVLCAPLLVVSIGCSSTDKAVETSTTKMADQDANAANATGNVKPDTSKGNGLAPRGGMQARADDLLGDMSRDEQTRRKEAEYYAKQADRWFAEADYRKAMELYRKALAYDPGLQDAKKKLVDSMMFLGMRDGAIQSAMEEYAASVSVATQERVAEARRFIAAGEKAMADGDMQLALENFTRAREMFVWYDYEGVADVAADRDKAQRLFQEAEIALRNQAQAEKEAAERESMDQAEHLRQEDEAAQKRMVSNLKQRVREAIQNKEYAKAEELLNRILVIEPLDSATKKRLHQVREEGRAHNMAVHLETDFLETEKVWENLVASSIPYDDPFTFMDDQEKWRTTVQRRSGDLQTVSLDESYEVQQIRRTLATQKADFAFQDQSLNEVVAFLRTIADLNIQIDPEIDGDEQTVTLTLAGVRLEEALDLILKNIGLAYTFKENTLYITAKENAHGNTLFDIYNVTDILNKIRDFPGPVIRVKSNDESDDGSGGSPFGFEDEDEDEGEPLDPDSLAELITKSTGGEELWEESQSEIQGHKGQLLVTATRELHMAVKSFLQNLRQDSDLFVIVEARFIDMTDDFLEDIGIDTRNLGQPAGTGFGTAYGVLNSDRSGGSDIGFNNLGNPTNPSLLMGQDRVAGRVQHILDGFIGSASGSRLSAALKGLTLQVTWLDPFQINAILRASQETRTARTLIAPRITASNGQRVHVSVITQRAYVQDYELVSGGTGLIVIEVADPVVSTFQEGVILDVQPVISSDRKYITLDVRPTLASLINGIISTVTVSLGSRQQAATNVDIDLPEISLQQAFTSVTVPDGGTVLLGGFRSLNDRKYESYIPLLGKLPILKNAFRRKVTLEEKRSLYILLTARVVDLRSEERAIFN